MVSTFNFKLLLYIDVYYVRMLVYTYICLQYRRKHTIMACVYEKFLSIFECLHVLQKNTYLSIKTVQYVMLFVWKRKFQFTLLLCIRMCEYFSFQLFSFQGNWYRGEHIGYDKMHLIKILDYNNVRKNHKILVKL